ncbi:Tetratricopeptide repeat protein [Stieleria magnilauensis]|uniref:Tetratricopeptide repeat protein n=1 Tax=Stieleria magnilauensis TaxID=2527963 RepID=A0ABX5XZ88_9BACT|nr:Tetratricopeptide repeat protein [Planctomycetes bacterium TBK1r]
MAPTKLPRFCFTFPVPNRSRGGVHRWGALWIGVASLLTVGCQDDTALVREIQSRRQAQQETLSRRDHLGESFVLLRKYVELDPQKAQEQIAFHLNGWSATRPPSEVTEPKLVDTLGDLISQNELADRVTGRTFLPSDVVHLRDSYLFHSLYSWVDVPQQDESLLTDWFKQQRETLPAETVDRLVTATRLFDWTIRNIALEPNQPLNPAPQGPDFPAGIEFRGAGYRQTDFQTVMRGTGDGLQRAGVFTQLCRQSGIPAAVLGTIDGQSGAVTPFCVGVLAGDQIYLFEPTLGVFVPGPDQVGIATLAQARRDAVVLRRLGIAGLDQFTYPVTKEDVQQCVALLNLLPEAISPRMKKLQSGLTGDRRMNVYVDADTLAERFDAVTGISSVRLWDVPVKAEIYQSISQQYTQRDPVFAFWYMARWAMMDAGFESARELTRGRWQHLKGQFADLEEDSVTGARTLYMNQRAPEFEIEDLRIDVELQKQYGIRRELGVDAQVYDQQVAQIQGLLRMGKRTATYWLSLLQADDGRLETAESWLEKRVLTEEQQSYWTPAARYNLARLHEALGKTEQAIEMYKREGEPQEHGNRVRARLVAKQVDE